MSNSAKHLFSISRQILLYVLFATVLINCGGGGGGTPAAGGGSVLSGTAATGAALNGVVNVYGSSGGEVLGVATDAAGNYSADVSGLTPPFCVCAVPDNSSLATQYSYASGAGTANITPLTTLTLFYANGEQDPASLITDWPASANSVIASIPDAQALVNANFDGVFSIINSALNIDFETYDFATTVFAIGDIIDQILDLLSIDVTTGGTPVIAVNGSTFTFDPDIDTSSIDIGGSSGSGGDGFGFGDGSGMLAITGAGSALLQGSDNFSPVSYVEVFGGGFVWADAAGAIVVVIFDELNQNQINIIGVTDPGDTISWGAFNVNGIAGATYNGSTVTFANVTLTVTEAPDNIVVSDVVVNGSLGE